MRLADLFLNHVPLSWEQALALVQGLGDLGLPDDPRADIVGALTDIALEPDGRLAVLPGSTSAVSAAGLAMLLRHALPEPGSGDGAPPPGALRYTLSRALKEVEAPPIVSAGQLTDALRRFERTDRAAALRGIHARSHATPGVAPRTRPAGARRDERPRQTAPARQGAAPGRPTAASVVAANAVPDLPLYPQGTGGYPREAAGRAGTVRLGAPSSVSPPAPPTARASRPAASERGGAGRRLALAIATLAVIAMGGLVGYLAYSEWPRLEATARTMAEAVRWRWEEADRRQPQQREPPAAGQDGQAARTPADPAGPAEGAAGEGAAGTAGRETARQPEETSERPAATRDRGRSEESEETGAEVTPAPATPAVPEAAAAEAGEGAGEREGRVVQALDAGRRPIFSPSFAFDGSAVFFHQDTPEGSGLREARSDSAGEVLHVVSLLDDGSRNYHPRLSPDGSLVAFDSDRDGVRGVYLSARDGSNVRRVSGPGYAAVPSWSPDGSRLAFIKAEPSSAGVWNIWVLALAGGEMTRLTSHRFGQPWGASWFPDGRRICYSHEDRLIVFDTANGESRLYPSPLKGRLVRTPAVSPDGRRVIFQLYRDGAWLLDLADGSTRRILADPTAEEFAWAPDGRRVAFHSRRDGQWGVWVMANQN